MDRICSPAETFERVFPFLERFGITRIGRQTGLDCIGIPVWCAYTPNAKSIVVAQGKGLTDADARTSAAMEALERAVACEPVLGAKLTSVLRLDREGEEADLLSSLVASGKHGPSPDDELFFVEGRDLLSGRRVHVPMEAVCLDRTLADWRYWQSSDGLASGNNHDETVFYGLLERIERDAHVLWQVLSEPRQHARCVAPEAFSDQRVRKLVAMIEDKDISLQLFDITSDLKIPCIAAFLANKSALRSTSARYVDVTFGCGAHPRPEQAAIRAITEAAQSRVTHISGARDDIFPESYRRPLSDRLRRLFDARPGRDPPCGGPAGLDQILGCLSQAGIRRAISVPLGHPDLPFAVSKILVPDLENPEGARRQKLGPRAISATLIP
ncbi:ribosomal protein S12 methylthiotransferase accessory factor [Neorhizobium sp. R1-B]|uniref:YcaO-like family protein n=1 Tax=Neorhizobium sp. R1-B TaxID=2485162 RepID=UPI001066DE4A|nr:YcaO-like family protein [Neorhizobium sp. R1-B]TDX82222.1 ribosomal protein S12 methylthiotransferase accessory factor [Neorhizobium sp. R1-B]